MIVPSRLVRAGALFAVLAGAACDLRADFYLTDTEGWGYRVSCSKTRCDTVVRSPYASLIAASACPPGSAPGFALAGRRVPVVCHACVREHELASTPELSRCRAVRCAHNGECPPFHGGTPLQCLHGLCQAPADPLLDRAGAVGLCMSGAGPSGRSSPQERLRMSLADAACRAGDQCDAPAGCQTP